MEITPELLDALRPAVRTFLTDLIIAVSQVIHEELAAMPEPPASHPQDAPSVQSAVPESAAETVPAPGRTHPPAASPEVVAGPPPDRPQHIAGPPPANQLHRRAPKPPIQLVNISSLVDKWTAQVEIDLAANEDPHVGKEELTPAQANEFLRLASNYLSHCTVWMQPYGVYYHFHAAQKGSTNGH